MLLLLAGSVFSCRSAPVLWCSFPLVWARGYGLEEKNRCELHIWPVSKKTKPEVLVRWQPELRSRGAAMSGKSGSQISGRSGPLRTRSGRQVAGPCGSGGRNLGLIFWD